MLATFALAEGDEATAIAFDGTNMWVIAGNGDVTKLSPTGAMLGTFAVGGTPRGIAFDGTNMWVTDGDASVIELSPTGVTLGTLAVGSQPSGIAFERHQHVGDE